MGLGSFVLYLGFSVMRSGSGGNPAVLSSRRCALCSPPVDRIRSWKNRTLTHKVYLLVGSTEVQSIWLRCLGGLFSETLG